MTNPATPASTMANGGMTSSAMNVQKRTVIGKGKTMTDVMFYEDWLRGCVYHDGRYGQVTLACEDVLKIADFIESQRRKTVGVDVAPVRHGCLVDAGISASGNRLTMCTICKRKMREGVEIGIVSRYCPNCGVRLDGDIDE